MDEIESYRELTTPEQLTKLVLGAVVGFLAKKIVEDAVEAAFRHRRP
jgi:hypothetical protein